MKHDHGAKGMMNVINAPRLNENGISHFLSRPENLTDLK